MRCSKCLNNVGLWQLYKKAISLNCDAVGTDWPLPASLTDVTKLENKMF